MFLPSSTKSKEVLTTASNRPSVVTDVVTSEYEEARHSVTRRRLGQFGSKEAVEIQDGLKCNWSGLV
jgi:hypothetical protein